MGLPTFGLSQELAIAWTKLAEQGGCTCEQQQQQPNREIDVNVCSYNGEITVVTHANINEQDSSKPFRTDMSDPFLATFIWNGKKNKPASNILATLMACMFIGSGATFPEYNFTSEFLIGTTKIFRIPKTQEKMPQDLLTNLGPGKQLWPPEAVSQDRVNDHQFKRVYIAATTFSGIEISQGPALNPKLASVDYFLALRLRTADGDYLLKHNNSILPRFFFAKKIKQLENPQTLELYQKAINFIVDHGGLEMVQQQNLSNYSM